MRRIAIGVAVAGLALSGCDSSSDSTDATTSSVTTQAVGPDGECATLFNNTSNATAMARAAEDSQPTEATAWVGVMPNGGCGAVITDGQHTAFVVELIDAGTESSIVEVPGYSTNSNGQVYPSVPIEEAPPWASPPNSYVVNGQVVSPEASPATDPEY